MVVLVAVFAMVLKAPPRYPDRAQFLNALKALPDRAPKADVLKVLGKPDRVESSQINDGHKPIVEETWYYGTDGPKGAATLARFEIYDGQLAYHPVFEEPPAPSEISEAELRKGIHIVLDLMPQYIVVSNRDTSTWVVTATNRLLPFGETKCKAILGECGRLIQSYSQLNPYPFFLCYSLFDPPQQPGYFDVYGPVWDAPKPEDGKKRPRWPVEIVDNVPIVRGKPMGAFGGFAPSFADTFKKLRDRIHLRKSSLSLPK